MLSHGRGAGLASPRGGIICIRHRVYRREKRHIRSRTKAHATDTLPTGSGQYCPLRRIGTQASARNGASTYGSYSRRHFSRCVHTASRPDEQGDPVHHVCPFEGQDGRQRDMGLSLIHISEPTRLGMISYAVFCLKKKKKKEKKNK